MNGTADYHLESLNEWLDRSKRFAARTSLFVDAAIVVLALLFLGVYGPKLIAGTISELQEVTLFVMLAGGCAFSYRFTRRNSGKSPGARRLRMGDTGLDLTYPDGRTQALRWDSSSTEFELLRFRGYERDSSGRTPYYLILDGTATALTEGAYTGLLGVVEDRGLVVSSTIGYPWYRLVFGRPLVIKIRGGSGRTSLGREMSGGEA